MFVIFLVTFPVGFLPLRKQGKQTGTTRHAEARWIIYLAESTCQIM